MSDRELCFFSFSSDGTQIMSNIRESFPRFVILFDTRFITIFIHSRSVM